MTCDLLQGKEALKYAKTPDEETQCCRFVGMDLIMVLAVDRRKMELEL